MYFGSSPRVWGTLYAPEAFAEIRRFIPTRVGNTRATSEIRAPVSVHPHACGEHNVPTASAPLKYGSSPRVWGTQGGGRTEVVLRRFIPTRVGNTGSGISSAGTISVHPHACGEHGQCQGRRHPLRGSSPRVWGTPSGLADIAVRGRFIPTRVGNTPRPPVPETAGQVHPHACGEHHKVLAAGDVVLGSSPRVWGTL